jgi:Zn-dependent protease with chaperone function
LVGICYLVASVEGAYFGFILSSMLLILTCVLGDRLILILSEARKTSKSNDLTSTIQNYAFRLGVKGVEVYSTKKYQMNILSVCNIFGRTSVIIGEQLYDSLTPAELKTVVYSTLFRAKEGDVTLKTITAISLTIFYFPFAVLNFNFFKFFRLKPFSDKKRVTSLSNIFVHFIIYPINLLRVRLFQNKSKIERFDRMLLDLIDCKNELYSAIFKISRLKQDKYGHISDFYVEDLSIASNFNSSLENSLVGIGFKSEDRLKSL